MRPMRDRPVTIAMAQRGVRAECDGIATAFDHGSGGSEPSALSSGSIGVLWITVTL
jgi:hypothetical protein